MKNLKISSQLILLVTGLMVAFAAATYLQIRSSADSIYNERYEMLRTQVESGISVLKFYYDQEKAGELTEEQAKAQAFAAVNAIRYTPDGYLFGYDYDINMVFHYDASKVGKSLKGQPDPKGHYYREELVKLGQQGGGLTDFYASKPGQPTADATYRKTAYARAFEPWKVVVITGVYMDDLDALVREKIWMTLWSSLVLFAAALGAAFVVIRGISKPLTEVHAALKAVADEDVRVAIPHAEMRNEIGLMAKATQALQKKIRERHTMAARQAAQEEAINAERQQNLRQQQDEAHEQARVVSTIGQALEALAAGDLTIRCGDIGIGYAGLRNNFNEALSHLEAAMGRVNAKGNDIGVSKEEIRRASNELSQRTERQAASLEETSAALDEL
ncbi:cache domain-containing protein, partial [Rhizobium sp. BR 318]